MPEFRRMHVRDADPVNDAAAVAAIYRPAVEDGWTSFEAQAPGADEMRARIEAGCPAHPWLVAELDGPVVGYAYASPHRARAAYRWTAEVSVYVAADAHRRGVGRALYAALLERLRGTGMHLAVAGVALPNDASIALHRAVGFTAAGVFREVGFKAGAWRDVGWWQLVLSDGPPRPGGSSDGSQAAPRVRP